MILRYGYGAGEIPIKFPDGHPIEVLKPRAIPSAGDELEIVRRSVERPIGSARLRDIAKPGRRVAIVTSDVTRPVPTAKLLPAVLRELEAAGVADRDVEVVFALGSHRPHTEAERRALIGEEAYGRVRCSDSDPGDCVRMGRTSRGTPVDVTRAIAEAGLRVLLGNIEYHYFAGYSGGMKAILPGVSSREAIRINHARMIEPNAEAGRILGNPVREDIDESLAICPVSYIVNAILDERKRIVDCFAGDPILAHRAGCERLDELSSFPIHAPAELVVVGAGGKPKDMNLYQAQKALDNAARAVRPGGVILFVAECAEGFGEETFERWMTGMAPEEMIREIGRDFVLGGHKAAAIELTLRKASVFMIGALPDGALKQAGILQIRDPSAAFERARSRFGEGYRILAMPWGGSTLPMLGSGIE